MEKIIKIGDKEVRLNNNVVWTMEYRDQFGKDILPAIMPLMASMIEGVSTLMAEASDGDSMTARGIAEALEGRAMEVLLPMFQAEFVDLVLNVTWAMAKAADESIEPPKRWVRQFDGFYLDEIGPALLELVLKGFVSSKNLKRLKKLGNELKNLQPSQSTTSSSPDSNED
ncbi:MAG: hypothetical protein IKG01_10570 [Lachnospiraceae bacterium]|nr:hypothetical protein [Lachnospiraceae bacterium]